MAFKLFELTNKRGLEPRVSIRNNGQVYFNLGAIHRFGLKDYKYVQMLCDEDEKKIGVMPTNDEQASGKLNLSIRDNVSAGAWVSAKTFFDYFNIKLPKNMQKVNSIQSDDGMIILDYPEVEGVESGEKSEGSE